MNKFTLYYDEALILINIIINYINNDSNSYNSVLIDKIFGLFNLNSLKSNQFNLIVIDTEKYWYTQIPINIYKFLLNKDINNYFKYKFINSLHYNSKYWTSPIILRQLIHLFVNSHQISENNNYTVYEKNLIQIQILQIINYNYDMSQNKLITFRLS